MKSLASSRVSRTMRLSVGFLLSLRGRSTGREVLPTLAAPLLRVVSTSSISLLLCSCCRVRREVLYESFHQTASGILFSYCRDLQSAFFGGPGGDGADTYDGRAVHQGYR